MPKSAIRRNCWRSFWQHVLPTKNAIVAGIFIATLLNHLVSAALGVWLASAISPEVMKWVVGGSFIAVGLWLLLPDKDEDPDGKWLKYGAFTATVVLFFLAEIGDKTQIATVLLAAKYQSILLVDGRQYCRFDDCFCACRVFGRNADAQNSGQSSAHCCMYLVLPAGYF